VEEGSGELGYPHALDGGEPDLIAVGSGDVASTSDGGKRPLCPSEHQGPPHSEYAPASDGGKGRRTLVAVKHVSVKDGWSSTRGSECHVAHLSTTFRAEEGAGRLQFSVRQASSWMMAASSGRNDLMRKPEDVTNKEYASFYKSLTDDWKKLHPFPFPTLVRREGLDGSRACPEGGARGASAGRRGWRDGARAVQ